MDAPRQPAHPACVDAPGHGTARRAGRAAELDLAHVVGARIERRIDVHEVHLAVEAGREQMGEDLLVVAVEEQPTAIEPLGPVGPVDGLGDDPGGRLGSEPLDELRRERPDLSERPFADPGEHRPALGAGDLDMFPLGAGHSRRTGTSGVRSFSSNVAM